MAVGLPAKTTYADGDVFSASDINDTNGTLNLVGQELNYYAGKNKIINGDFGVWQRGTTFTNPADGSYTSDRIQIGVTGSPTTYTVSREAFTPGAAPVAGYEGQFFYRSAQTTLGTLTNVDFWQKVENVRTLAGQTATLSFWAKADSTRNLGVYIAQNFGSGGSGTTFPLNRTGTPVSVTTSWQHFTFTFTMTGVSGKTIGANSYLQIAFRQAAAAGYVLDIWGLQLEAGSAATAFQTATGTIQGELAACQRYYVRYNASASGSNAVFAPSGMTIGTTTSVNYITLPVELRVYPSSVDFGGSLLVASTTANVAVTAVTLQDRSNTKVMSCTYTVASGLTTNTYSIIRADSSTSAFLGFSAEL
jgi:hypothetical protein